MWNKIKEFFSLKEDEYGVDTIEVPIRGENIVSIGQKRSVADHQYNYEVVVMHPTSFSDALLVLRFLKNRSAVLINIGDMSKEEALRLVDFVTGCAYALDGAHEQAGEGILLITPSHIGIHSNQSLLTTDGIAVGRG